MATEPLSCFAVAAPGLEPIVARELKALGEQPRPEDGGVSWKGDARSVMRANLWLRAATRVLVRVAKFQARTFAELERHAKRVDWGRYLAPDATAEFRITSRKSRLLHTGAISERLRDALGSGLGALGSSAGHSPEPTAQSQLFVVRVLRDEFEISADSSGELLHMRGYRQAVAKAPLRETLAAALLLAADWDPATPLLDPFCGSGTIAIEGALLARRMAPGARRPFAFTQWPGHDAAAWRTLVAAARSGELASAPPILASDRDAGAIRMAGENAERAGVAGAVSFERAAISDVAARCDAGLVATNPPYGKRADGGTDLRNLYARFGQVCRERLPEWRVTMYAPNLRLARETGVPLVEAFRTSNGGIRIVALRS